MPFFLHTAALVQSLFKSRRQLALENLALRQQLVMLKPSVKRPQVSPADRLFWILFSKYVEGWRPMLHALHPDTVVRWHRQAIYGDLVQRRIRGLSIDDVIMAPRSPWQNPFCERVIGSIRRDCLDHVIVLNERHLRRILREYFRYYHTCRTHISLNKDPPETRIVEPPELGNIVAFPRVGGLHHRYVRMAA